MLLAHRIAMDTPFIRAEMIEAIEFYELALRYNVKSVPLTTIKGDIKSILGAELEGFLIGEIERISNLES